MTRPEMNQQQLESARKLLFIVLGVDLVVSIAIGLNAMATIPALRDIRGGVRFADESFIESLKFWDNVSMLAIATLIGVGLALVRWLNSCYRFASVSISASGFKNEKWTVVGWIIPVFNLFKPYQIINEIYKVGSPRYRGAEAWSKERGSGLLLTWWVFWAVTHFIAWIAARQMFTTAFRKDTTLTQAIGLYEAQVWLCVFSVVIAVMWYAVVNQLTQRLIARSLSPVALSIVDDSNAPRRTNKAGDVSMSFSNPADAYDTQPISLQTEGRSSVKPNGVSSSAAAESEECFFSMAFEELNSGRAAQGLWAKCFAEADGDENKAKAKYLRARATQLRIGHDASVQEETARARALEEAARAVSLERATRIAASEQQRRKLVEAGHFAHATLEESFAELAEAAYTVKQADAGYWVQSTRDLGPPTVLKDFDEVRSFVGKHVAFSKATTIEECFMELAAAGFSVKQADAGYWIRSTKDKGSPAVLKNLGEVRLFVEKNIAFSQATEEECVERLKTLGCAFVLKSNGHYSVTLPSGARRVLETVDEIRTLLRKLVTKGQCPKCETEIALNSQRCPRCDVVFEASAAWRVKPL